MRRRTRLSLLGVLFLVLEAPFDAAEFREGVGAVVGGVEADGPAARAGVKRGDVILSVDGHKVDDVVDLRNRIAQTPPGTAVRLEILRDGREKTFRVKLGELGSEQVASLSASRQEEALGWEMQELTPELAQRLGYEGEKGVVITDVQPGGVAHQAGLRRGDLVLEIDRRPIRSMADYNAAMGRKKAGDAMLILARRGRQTFFVALHLPE